MFCCANCFHHPWLKRRVAELSKRSGRCDYCTREEEEGQEEEQEPQDVPLIEPGELSSELHRLLSMYEPTDDFDNGEPLIQLVQWHWEVFNEDTLSDQTQRRLLEHIVNSDWDDDDGEPMVNASELYVPLGGALHTTHRERWEEFCDEVRRNPDEPVPFDEFFEEELSKLEVAAPTGATFYRARPGFKVGECDERLPFRGADIGAPPIERAYAGRANVEGQRVIYCADEEKTAIAETRSPRGFYVSVGTLSLKRDTRILDLTGEREEINPFVTDTLKWEVEIESLLTAFAEEMSRPLERSDDKAHYVPCQRLADYIREAGYDGIRYPSALSPDGHNVVLFDPEIAEPTDSKLARITEVELKYEWDYAAPMETRLARISGRADE